MINIIKGDNLIELKNIPSDSIDTIITSPPYNKGLYDKHTPSKHDVWKQRNIKYVEFNDNLPREEYVKQQTELLKECIRIIKPNGSIFYNHKQVIHDHKIDFPEYVLKFNIRQIITWDRGSTPQLAPIRWYPTTEFIFWITKSNVQPKFYRKGKFDKEVWRINAKPDDEHPAPFPEELVEQIILSTTDENDIILDPYAGRGTVGIVAKKYNRNCTLIEREQTYIDIINKNIAKTKTRQINIFD